MIKWFQDFRFKTNTTSGWEQSFLFCKELREETHFPSAHFTSAGDHPVQLMADFKAERGEGTQLTDCLCVWLAQNWSHRLYFRVSCSVEGAISFRLVAATRSGELGGGLQGVYGDRAKNVLQLLRQALLGRTFCATHHGELLPVNRQRRAKWANCLWQLHYFTYKTAFLYSPHQNVWNPSTQNAMGDAEFDGFKEEIR